jgi:uncharacterized protein (TIGR03437 family)
LNQDNSVNSADNAERTGNAVVLFLTGMGAVLPVVASGDSTPADVLSRAIEEVSVTVGGRTAEVLFAGMTPGSVGLGQVNILIPSGVTAGSRVPVIVKIRDQVSNTVTISVR